MRIFCPAIALVTVLRSLPLLLVVLLTRSGGRSADLGRRRARRYLMILVTRPAPTVRPPSRMAKRRPSSMAIGWISATDISVLSPGMTISVPSGGGHPPVPPVGGEEN